MENQEPNLAEAAGPEPDAQLRSERQKKYQLGKPIQPSGQLALSSRSGSREIVELKTLDEGQALEELHLAKSALITVQAHQKQERLELSAKHTAQAAIQEQERVNLRTMHAQQLAQAEMKILELRSRYLEAQRTGGQERRMMKEFKEESRFTQKTDIAAARQRLSDVREAIEKLTVLASDWTAAGLRTEPAETKMERFDSRYIEIYEEGKLEGETPDEFIARQKEWLDKMHDQAREALAAAKAGPHVTERLKKLPPLFQPKEGAAINWKARKKRLLFLGLAKVGEPGIKK